ncbi:MAG: peptidoglycan DD-metalloendopeptidase family protein [Candidatus Dojkabacteria bacterium]
MNNDNSQYNKNIPGLSFKTISSLPNFDENYLFVDDEIVENQFIRNLKKKFNTFYSKQKAKNNIIEFFLSLGEYIFLRLKVILVLISVLFDIIFESFNTKKNVLATKMFWGRGNFLSSALKFLSVAGVFIIAITYLYRKPVVSAAGDQQLDRIGTAQVDLMVMSGSINTVIPKDRPRRYTEEYIVKRGDTLASIAGYYDLNVKTIMWANNITNERALKLGQTLEIPPADGVIVTVKKGDTVESLAKKYETNAADIVEHNWLESPFTLTVGEELFVPNGIIKDPPKPVYATAPISLSKSSSSVPYSATPVDPNVGKFLGWPVGGPSAISRGFYRGHYGIDIYPTPPGSRPNVVAAAPGVVIRTGYAGARDYGYFVQVDHGNGYTTLYAHLSSIAVRSGTSVARGQALGVIGDTGLAYGVHVHFELRRGEAWSGVINPAPYMQ